MKKLLIFSLLAAIFTFGFSTDIQAQSRGKKKKKSSKTDDYFDDSGNFTQKLWYGAGGTLGFSGGNNFSLFRIGISPMVGYKITPWLSAGPRFSVVYTGIKGGAVNVEERNGEFFQVGANDNTVHKIGTTDLGVGVFARGKFLQSFFVHAELESYTSSRPLTNNNFNFFRYDDTLEFVKVKENRLNTYIGAGYNSSGGGLVGYEIMLLYNLTVPENSFDNPLEIRAGLTYNF